jgi:hypothetical protein
VLGRGVGVGRGVYGYRTWTEVVRVVGSGVEDGSGKRGVKNSQTTVGVQKLQAAEASGGEGGGGGRDNKHVTLTSLGCQARSVGASACGLADLLGGWAFL